MFTAWKKDYQNDRLFYILFSILILLGITARIVWLNKFPPGVSHDELDLILSAKAYWQTGRDASGVAFPRSLFSSQLESATTGIPSLLLSPLLGIFSINTGFVRFIYSLINILTAIVGAKLIHSVTDKKKLSLIFLAVFLLNPWSFVYSRMTLAAPFSLLFLLSGTYFLFSDNKRSTILSTTLFIIGAFTYFGAFPAVMLITSVLYAFQAAKNKGERKGLAISYLLIFSTIFGYILISKTIPDSMFNTRSSELILLQTESFAKEVNISRKRSLTYPLKNLFINKGSAMFDLLSEKYLNAFSTRLLFTYGDFRAAYNFNGHGLLYYSDFFLIIIGVIGIYKLGPPLFLITASFLLLGPAGSMLSLVENSYIFRAFPMLFGYTLLISTGVWYAVKISRHHRSKATILLFMIYLLFTARFLGFYFFEYSVKEAENHYLTERVLVNFMLREKNPTHVVVKNPSQIFRQLVFFSRNTDLLASVGYDNKTFRFDNFTISNKCPEKTDNVLIQQRSLECETTGETWSIQNQKDAGEKYLITAGTLCSEAKLDAWRRRHLVSDYDIEDMDNETFCNRWIATANR